jgi:phage terminase small subunit
MKREDIQLIIDNTITHLQEEYGEVKPEWEVQLELLEDTLDMIVTIQEEIKTNGVFNPKTFKKNPLINSLKDYQTLLLKLSQKLGCSPYDISKIKKLSEEDTTEDFIEALTE